MRRNSLLSVLLLSCAATPIPGLAHSMVQAAVLLDFRGSVVDAELQLPVERVRAALGAVAAPQSVTTYILSGFSATLPDGRIFDVGVVAPIRLTSIEGSPYLAAHLRLVPPAHSNADLFNLTCNVLLDRVPSQAVLVSIRSDWRTSTFANDPHLIAVLRGGSRSVRVDRRDGHWWRGFASVFELGLRHIAEGTDHLLFLLALLLPAPLIAFNMRWAGHSGIRRCLWQIGKVVTAFTVGHSITLAAGALDVIRVPSRPIEVLIAVSILVSALHALRPIFPGREAVIAGCFGMVHGLAFATTLADLGLARWERVAGIFGFNAGIETMQIVVVAAALPSLILLSRTRLYAPVRITGAVFAATAAAAWIIQRLWDVPNPIDTVVMALAQRAVWLAFALTMLALIARNSPRLLYSIAFTRFEIGDEPE